MYVILPTQPLPAALTAAWADLQIGQAVEVPVLFIPSTPDVLDVRPRLVAARVVSHDATHVSLAPSLTDRATLGLPATIFVPRGYVCTTPQRGTEVMQKMHAAYGRIITHAAASIRHGIIAEAAS